jgi:hypothetical protein
MPSREKNPINEQFKFETGSDRLCLEEVRKCAEMNVVGPVLGAGVVVLKHAFILLPYW